MIFNKAIFSLIVPLICDSRLFERSMPETFERYFTANPVSRSFQLEGSPLLWDDDRAFLRRYVLKQSQRKIIGIHGNENHIYTMVKCGICFQLRKIRLWLFRCGIAFLTMEIFCDGKSQSEVLDLVSELSSVQLKRAVTYQQAVGRNQLEQRTFTINEVIDRLIRLQESVFLQPCFNETYQKAYCLFLGTGSYEDEESLGFFLEMLRLQRRSNMRVSQGISEENVYRPFDYITWAMSEKVLAVVGNLEKGGAENEYFLIDPGGLQKTVFENYLTVYLHYLSVWLCGWQIKRLYHLTDESIDSREPVTVQNSEGICKLMELRRIPMHRLTTEPHINELFEEKLCRNTWKMTEKTDSALLSRVYDLLTNVQGNVIKIDDRTAGMEKQLSRILHFIENDMSKWLKEQKKGLQVYADEEDDDRMVAGFVAKSSRYINCHIQEADDLVQQETANLGILFGNIWERLLPESRTSLVSAEMLWKNCADIKRSDFDFSGVCISATSALETELKRIFFTGFQDYLAEKYGSPEETGPEKAYEFWPDKLLSRSKTDYEKKNREGRIFRLERADVFTMGMLPYLLGKHDRRAGTGQDILTRMRMEEYLKTIVGKQYREAPLYFLNHRENFPCFVERCEQVRKKYRNPSAHASILTRECAAECCFEIIGSRTVSGFTADVTGLIIMLYGYLSTEYI